MPHAVPQPGPGICRVDTGGGVGCPKMHLPSTFLESLKFLPQNCSKVAIIIEKELR